MSQRVKAELLLVVTTFIWGSTFVIVKGALSDASPLPFVAVRFILASFLIAMDVIVLLFGELINFNTH